MEVLKRTLTASAFLHIFFLGWLFLNQPLFSPKEEFFFIDFISPPSSSMKTPSISMASGQKITITQPTKTVHPKEDLILKNKESKKPKVKENLLDIPQSPSIPRLMNPANKKNSSIPGIPGSELGTDPQGSVPNSGIGLEVGGGAAISGTNFQYSWYIQGMKKKLDSNWILYSQSLSRLTAQIAFTILKNGSVQKIEVEKSSGDGNFDQAALRAVKSAVPLPPLPTEFSEKDLRVHVRFSLKN